MTGERENIRPKWVLIGKTANCVTIRTGIRHDVPSETYRPKISAPAGISRRHIPVKISLYAKPEVRLTPVLASCFRYGSDGTVAYVFTSWVFIVVAIHIRAYRRGKAPRCAQGKAIQQSPLRIGRIYPAPYPPYTRTSTAAPLHSFRHPLYISQHTTKKTQQRA